ncbi:hypothetical protein OH77DRAFT_1580053 [Trametes cingulata]|nr:hypothetical protein OH77DRAFT_1580053 [Trametes cingulata]
MQRKGGAPLNELWLQALGLWGGSQFDRSNTQGKYAPREWHPWPPLRPGSPVLRWPTVRGEYLYPESKQNTLRNFDDGDCDEVGRLAPLSIELVNSIPICLLSEEEKGMEGGQVDPASYLDLSFLSPITAQPRLCSETDEGERSMDLTLCITLRHASSAVSSRSLAESSMSLCTPFLRPIRCLDIADDLLKPQSQWAIASDVVQALFTRGTLACFPPPLSQHAVGCRSRPALWPSSRIWQYNPKLWRAYAEECDADEDSSQGDINEDKARQMIDLSFLYQEEIDLLSRTLGTSRFTRLRRPKTLARLVPESTSVTASVAGPG